MPTVCRSCDFLCVGSVSLLLHKALPITAVEYQISQLFVAAESDLRKYVSLVKLSLFSMPYSLFADGWPESPQNSV
jgi:hypothetical protein